LVKGRMIKKYKGLERGAYGTYSTADEKEISRIERKGAIKTGEEYIYSYTEVKGKRYEEFEK
jgi:hypothetical protein